jgi:hypothetical protein
MILGIVAMALASPGPSCEGCHADVHQAWAGTRHATAFTNPAFQAIWSRWRDPWCTSCHAPEGGVGCASCHLQEGQIASPTSPSARARAVHAVVEVPDLGTRACARCHQFDAPQGGGPVQTTGSEHASWTQAGGSSDCASCHGGGHAVPSSRDPSRLRAALSVAVHRDETEVVATLTASGLGHRFPTGDPWRRLVLQLLEGETVVRQWTLSRSVEGVDASLREVADRRLPLPDAAGTSSLALRAEAPLGASRWRLSYQMVDPSHTELASSEAGYLVAEGEID